MKGIAKILTVLLHDGQDLNDDLGGRSDQDLSLSSSFGVDDVVQAVVKDGDSDHFDGLSEKRICKYWYCGNLNVSTSVSRSHPFRPPPPSLSVGFHACQNI